ncbi:uncharacterized protein LOC120324666 [Pipra filicauda]|uniref:Uncharacterized protein LOC120324666 n=1 Tax=Pipra filicauda TaxID=649802 RepID=A0A7R5L1M7_9PASS|nr:uncharacterized protein LOC120324666 [Pipra filicauda]
MGRSSPGDHDDLHGSESRRNRQLDPLYSGQEGSSFVVGRTSLTHKNGISSQPLRIIVFLGLISLAETTVRIETPDPYLFVPEHTDVNLTCLFSDDQGAELRDVHVKWRWRDQDQIMTEGVTTVWDATQQKGYTVLQVPKVYKAMEGTYMCVVWIWESFDYGHIEIQTINTTQKTVTKVRVLPTRKQSDMWDGPPLKINCTFQFDDCRKSVKVKWWKLNVANQSWESQSQGVSWWSNSKGGKGWLNISNPRVGKTEGTFLCVVSCGEEKDHGIRTAVAVPHQGIRVRPEHSVYSAQEGRDLILSCKIPEGQYFEYGWWFKGQNLKVGKRHQIEKRADTIVLKIKEIQRREDEGQYTCWISRDDWWETGITVVHVRTERITRQVSNLQIPDREVEQENLVVGLIRDFGKAQNVTKITACLPMPHAAGDPIPWGIIPVPEIPRMFKNTTWNCRFVTRTWNEMTDACLLRDKVTKKQCEQMPGYFRWVESEKIGKLEGNCLISGSVTYPCFKVQVRIKREKQEEVCQNTTSSTTMEEWQTIWGPSLLETYSYIGKVQWCIHWKGKKNQTYSIGNRGNHNWRTETRTKEDWNCTRIYTCDTPDDEIGLTPVKTLLQLGCECRGYNHTIKGSVNNIDCRTTTVRSPGNLVWVMGHGQWTTHIPINGPVVPVTLGIPTLCPFWKQNKLTSMEIQPRRKREVSKDIDDLRLGDWHEPSAGVKFGWALESLFAPISTYRNREMLFKLMGQTERLAAVTKKGFKDLNLQLQATSRMTIQNRMALDLILLKEHGVCGYLHAKDEHCCVHIPNVTQEVEKDISQLEQIDENVHELQKEAEHNWIGQLFSSLGLHVSGWISSVIQYGILIVIIIVIAITVYKCLLGMIVKEGQHTRRIMKAITRKEIISPQNESPPTYQETTA